MCFYFRKYLSPRISTDFPSCIPRSCSTFKIWFHVFMDMLQITNPWREALAFHVSTEIWGWCVTLLLWFLINLATRPLTPSKSLECCGLLQDRTIKQEIHFLQKMIIKIKKKYNSDFTGNITLNGLRKACRSVYLLSYWFYFSER